MTFNAAGVSSLTVDTSRDAKIDAFVIDRDELNAFQKANSLPIANGNIHWRSGYANIMGHSIKNFYQPSIISKIYNNAMSSYIKFMNSIQNLLTPINHITF